YPLEFRLSHDEMVHFYRDYPQFSRTGGFNLDPGVRNGMCLAGRSFCFVDALGNVYPCLNFKTAADKHEPWSKDSGARMGNIKSTPLAEVWQAGGLVARIRSSRRQDFRSCGKCSLGGRCSPCMAVNYEESGDIFERAPRLCGLNAAMS